MKLKTIRILNAVILVGIVSSCTDDQSKINNPELYDFSRDGISTVSFEGQTTRIAMAEEFIASLLDFETSLEFLQQQFTNQTSDGGDADPFLLSELNESTKSIRSKVATSRDLFANNTVEMSLIRDQFDDWIEKQVDEVFTSKDQLAEKGTAGQIADGTSVRYVNAKGLEYDQAIGKSLIGAMMIDQICNNYLSKTVLDEADNILNNNEGVVENGQAYTTMEHKWDEAYGYLFGASQDVTNPLKTLGDDSFLNKYLSRVENDSDFKGIADEIWQAFKLGRSAIVAADYEERDAQAAVIKENLAKVVAIRAVYYLQQGKHLAENASWGSAFHDFSEGYGFIYSLQFLTKPNSSVRYFTKNMVDEFLVVLEEGAGFWDLTSDKIDEMSFAIADKFDFTVEQAAE